MGVGIRAIGARTGSAGSGSRPQLHAGLVARSMLVAVVIGFAMCALPVVPARAASAFSWSAPVPISDGSELTAVSCPTNAFCAAVNKDGDIVTSTDPTGGGGAWTTTSIVSDSGLDFISCPTTQLCVASDVLTGDVLISTDPTGGAGAWSATNIVNPDGDGLVGATCPTTRLCVGVDSLGNVITSTDPTGGAGAWTTGNVVGGGGLDDVSCASSSLCVAVGGEAVSTSTNPAGGSRTWRTSTSFTLVTADSCPTLRLCVIGTDSSNVYSSTNPTGGPAAFHEALNVDHFHPFQPITGISCPTSNVCVIVGLSGDAVTSTEPTGGASAWRTQHIDNTGFDDISCPTRSLCVAVDQGGNAVVGKGQPALAGAHRLAAKISSASARVDHGPANLELACVGGRPGNVCRGTLSLTVRRRVHGQLRTVSLARGDYALKSGRRRPIALRLREGALALLARAPGHRLRAQASATVRGGNGARRVVVIH
jgi:hypothetical protein